MKKNFLALGTCAFALALGLVACDDSTSANGSSGDENPAEVSSSSILTTSSPTEDPGSSSSSVILSGGSAGVEGSSSSVTSSSSVESSSSVVSSSSEKSSSSVASSSSAKSSSSVASSSFAESSSSGVILSSSSEESSIKDGSEYDAVANTLTDIRDGQVYKTVTIGTQTWMAENLNYAYKGVKYNKYGYTSDSTSWCYGNDPSKCATYGRLYTWAAAMDSAGIVDPSGAGKGCGYGVYCDAASSATKVRGVCPSGWHLPTKEEWQQLVKPMAYHVDDYTTYWYYYGAGIELKTVDDWYSSSNKGTNASGFSALPAGRRYYHGSFCEAGDYAYFWSASERDRYYAYRLRLDNDRDYAYLNYDSMDNAFSVRCVQNN